MYTIYLHKKKHSIFDMNGVDVPFYLEKIKYLWKKWYYTFTYLLSFNLYNDVSDCQIIAESNALNIAATAY